MLKYFLKGGEIDITISNVEWFLFVEILLSFGIM